MQSLKVHLSVRILLFGIIAASATFFTATYLWEHHFLALEKEKAKIFAESLALSADRYSTANEHTLSTNVQQWLDSNPQVVFAILVDKTKRAEPFPLKSQIFLRNPHQYSNQKRAVTVIEIEGLSFLNAVIPLSYETASSLPENNRYVQIVFALTSFTETFFSFAKILSLLLFLTALSISLYVHFLLTKKVLLPLKNLIASHDSPTERNPDISAKVTIPLEIEQLMEFIQDLKGKHQLALRTDREENKKLKTLVNLSKDGNMVVDKRGKIACCNRVAENFLNISEGEAVGQKVLAYIGGAKFDDAFSSERWELLNRKTFKAPTIKNANSQRTLRIFTAEMVLDGKWNGIAVIRDISLQKRSENNFRDVTFAIDQLEDMLSGSKKQDIMHRRDITLEWREKQVSQTKERRIAIGTAISGVTHDFNNTVTSINGYSRMLLEKRQNKERQEELLCGIVNAISKAADNIKRVAQFNAPPKTVLEVSNLTEVVRWGICMLEDKYPGEANISVDIRAEGDVFAEKDQIQTLFVDLCENALHAIRNKGYGILQVTLEQDTKTSLTDIPLNLKNGAYAKLSIRDTGIGISENNFEKIFEPYFSTKGWGKGLGLSTAYGLVNRYNGKITVDSTLGEGSVFTVYLPSAKQPKKAQTQKAPPTDFLKNKNGGERVLIVEDEEMIAFSLKENLELYGYKVVAKTNAKEAIKLFYEGPDDFDIVMTDYNLPQISGDVLALKLMKIRPDIPVILCTGVNTEMNREKALALGIKEFVMKPFIGLNFDDLIQSVLSGRVGINRTSDGGNSFNEYNN